MNIEWIYVNVQSGVLMKPFNRANQTAEQFRKAANNVKRAPQIVVKTYHDVFYNTPVKVLQGFPEKPIYIGQYRK